MLLVIVVLVTVFDTVEDVVSPGVDEVVCLDVEELLAGNEVVPRLVVS